uniref:Truncated GIY-YIG endonuclease n=1 Tax=Sclerotinia borealis TaxID=77105 RepID=A0A088CAE8_9HELO|nr:truncated GIY-YIG endonuclease [Sclerotinia borealis]AHX83014.1 truncated GIY-YIG endonuclease [Sclerotinia borealis]
MDLARRILEHINNKHSNLHLQRAISKYDLSNFSLYILELLPADEDLTSEELSIILIKLEHKSLDLFKDKYNINPNAGKTRLGARHSEATRELMSQLRNGNPTNRTYSSEDLARMSERVKGSNNPMFGKSVTEENKKLISEFFSKSVYLYDANTLTLIARYSKHKYLVKDLGISPKTLIKYNDSGLVFRDKYIISSTELEPKDT